jgi:RNA polymerase sigma factor (sigma-70 family)
MATLPLLLTPDGRLTPVVALADAAEEIVEGDGVDRRGYEESFARLHRRAYDVAYRLLGSRPEAEDVAQEALARAFVHWPRIHGHAEPWTVRVAANLAVGTWRKRRRLARVPAEAVATSGPEQRARPGGAEGEGAAAHPQHVLVDHLELRRAMATLSRRQREVVVLRHLAGFSERETANALGCSEGTVKQHASRGLAALRRLLALADEDAPGADTPGMRSH